MGAALRFAAWLPVAACAALVAACGRPPAPPAFRIVAPLGLPPLPVPSDNPLSVAKVELGEKLFFDRRLSFNNTMSCALCHVPEQGFTSNELATAVGVEGRSLRRNAPTLFNTAYHTRLFHDGRETTLENQIWGPLLAANEMANPAVGFVLERIEGLPDYRGLFERAFDGRGVSVERIGQAIACYERTLVSGNSRFDRWRYGGEADALNADEQRGYRLFIGKAGCVQCHVIGDKEALFTDFRFHNTGIGWAHAQGPKARYQVQLTPGLVTQIGAEQLSTFAEPEQNDAGRFEITLDPQDRWAYKTPSLRNIALTAPYMHDGSLATLEAAVDFYDAGGIDNPNRDSLLKPLRLAPEEKRALVAFLEALTGDNVAALIRDARAAAIGQ
jgi:cytochrome c peroxidase